MHSLTQSLHNVKVGRYTEEEALLSHRFCHCCNNPFVGLSQTQTRTKRIQAARTVMKFK